MAAIVFWNLVLKKLHEIRGRPKTVEMDKTLCSLILGLLVIESAKRVNYFN
jgi:hypothetical protein